MGVRSLTSLLDDVYKALLCIDDEVHYGLFPGIGQNTPWNYIVYSRDNRRPSRNLTGSSAGVLVSIIRENYVPDATIDAVIDKVSGIPGVRLDENKDIEYVYDVRPGTTNVVEMVILHFVRGSKKQ